MDDTAPNAICRICKEVPAIERTSDDRGALVTFQRCPTCGQWRGLLDAVVAEFGRPANAALMPFLAAHIREANAAGETTVELTAETWRGFAEAHAHTSIPRRLEKLLRWYEKKSGHAGQFIAPETGVYPLIDAQNAKEVTFLTETLVAQRLLQMRVNQPAECRITARGWESLYPVSGGGVPGTCFVAMSFDPTMDPAFTDGILPALEQDCGFVANRVDRHPHNENITDRIIAGIRGSQFLVADFTLQRPGVYYEAGFAQGLGRTVIRTCRDTDFHHLHFDTRQFFHLKWSTPVGLRAQLADHVRSTIGWIRVGDRR